MPDIRCCVEIKLIILGFCCAVAFARPVWGVAVLLILEFGMFSLYQFATISSGRITLGPFEILPIVILSGFFVRPISITRIIPISQSYFPPPTNIHNEPRQKYAVKIILYSITPYLIWLMICIIRAAIFGNTEGYSSSPVRTVLSFIYPWSILLVIWFLRTRKGEIISLIIGVAFVTAIIHLVIQLLDIREIVELAYEGFYPRSDIQIEIMEKRILYDDFVRELPMGMFLLMFSGIYSFFKYLSGIKNKYWGSFWLFSALVQLMAIAITFTRSLTSQILAGYLFVIIFILSAGYPFRMIVRKLLPVFFIGVMCFSLICVAKSEIIDFWGVRIESSPEDFQIYSDDTVRGLDNQAAVNAIQDSPFFGWGGFKVPEKYFSREFTTEVHPLLETGLVGGFPGIALAIYFQLSLLIGFFYAAKNSSLLKLKLAPYFSILLVALLIVNTCGAGGTLSGRGLMQQIFFVGLMMCDYTDCEPRNR